MQNFKILLISFMFNLHQEAEAQGEDYDRLKLLEVTADDADKLDKRRKRKKNADVGFSGWLISILACCDGATLS